MNIKRYWAHGVAILLAIGIVSRGALAQQVSVVSDRQAIAGDRASALLEQRISVRLENVSLMRALSAIAQKSGVSLQYRADLVGAYSRMVTVRAAGLPLRIVLDDVLHGTGFVVMPLSEGRVGIVVGQYQDAPYTDGVIVGKVVNAKTQSPLANAIITVGQRGASVTTDEQGNFRLSVPSGVHQLSVRAVGFVRQIKEVTVSGNGNTEVQFVLEHSASVLDEVVVTGTVVATERKAISTPITVITAEEIERRGITRIEQFFRGDVPGVFVTEQGSRRYQGASTSGYSVNLGRMVTSQVYARGASGFGGGTYDDGTATPLKTYVDGIELLDPSYLGTIDPSSIERIEIITGPQAATVYGSGAMGGVMQIFTKKGSGAGTPEVTAQLKYGMLENSLSHGLTPTHNHGLRITGGSGRILSYNADVSYRYSGQWMPGLFSRTYGGALGATYLAGPITIGAAATLTSGTNGTGNAWMTSTLRDQYFTGEWIRGDEVLSQQVSGFSSQNLSLNADFLSFKRWQHHVTFGRNQTDFTLTPTAPRYLVPAESLYTTASSNGARNTVNYNSTLISAVRHILSSALTLGASGSWGRQMQMSGCLVSETATSFQGCTPYQMYVTKTMDDKSGGAFVSWRLGMFERLYFTLGLRAERNPSYGKSHKIDWTPTNGAAYTIEHGELTLKVLGSYGRATRAPQPDMRLRVISLANGYEPSQYVSQLEAPDLTPEYSRGPQGGIEAYWGNRGSVTVNHYRETVTDLIQRLKGNDSTYLTLPGQFSDWFYAYQYQNVAKVRRFGWELTGTMNMGPLAARGTYSWTDSKVLAFNNSTTWGIYTGMSFQRLPTHTGSMGLTYARRGTSIAWNMNFVGQSLQSWSYHPVYRRMYELRLRQTAAERTAWSEIDWVKKGFVMSDLAILHRLTPWASATINVVNLGNNYASEGYDEYPILGRQTSIGMSIRFPGSR